MRALRKTYVYRTLFGLAAVLFLAYLWRPTDGGIVKICDFREQQNPLWKRRHFEGDLNALVYGVPIHFPRSALYESPFKLEQNQVRPYFDALFDIHAIPDIVSGGCTVSTLAIDVGEECRVGEGSSNPESVGCPYEWEISSLNWMFDNWVTSPDPDERRSRAGYLLVQEPIEVYLRDYDRYLGLIEQAGLRGALGLSIRWSTTFRCRRFRRGSLVTTQRRIRICPTRAGC